jgi:hypothetical protein
LKLNSTLNTQAQINLRMSIDDSVHLDLEFQYKLNQNQPTIAKPNNHQPQDLVSNTDSTQNANEIFRPPTHNDFQLTDLLNTQGNTNNAIACEYNSQPKTEGKGVSTVDDSTEYRIHLDEDLQEISQNRYQRGNPNRPELLNEKMLGEIEARDQAIKNVRILDTPSGDPIISNSNFSPIKILVGLIKESQLQDKRYQESEDLYITPLNFEEETVQKSPEVTVQESSEKNSVSDSGSDQGSGLEKSESKEDDFTSSFLDRIANTNIGNEDKIYNHNNVLLGGTIEEMIIGNDVNFKKYSSKMFGNLFCPKIFARPQKAVSQEV